MKRGFFSKKWISIFNCNQTLLILGCLSGLIVGVLSASQCCDRYVPLMLRLTHMPLSIVGSACVWLWPLLLSLIVVFVHKRLVIVVAFFKSLCFGFYLCLITASFGDCAWLMRLCFMFTDIGAFPLLCRFWYCCICCRSFRRTAVSSTIVFLIISAIDICYISPFLMAV